MNRYLFAVLLTSTCIECGETVTKSEPDGPPEITLNLVDVETVSDDRVRISGSEGAVSPGGGQIAITNNSRGDDATVTEVNDDGSFSAELPGEPDDEYELVATTDSGSSSTQIVNEQSDVAGRDDCGPPIGEGCKPFAIPGAPEDWVEYQTNCGFAFRAPDDVREVEVRGIDSCAIQFENEYCTIMGGSGAFSSGLRDLEDPHLPDQYKVGQATINGFQAKIVTAKLDEWGEKVPVYLVAAHFPDPFIGEPDVAEDITADLYIFCDTSENRDVMLPVLGTIRFD